jgi:hypothetical protein
VIDLSSLVHPGGNFIWREVRGREISRFMYGAYGLEKSSIKPHNHSFYAHQMLLKNQIGQMKQIPFYFEAD